MILIGLFGMSGIILLFVGLVATYPISMFIIVMLYRELAKFGSEKVEGIIVEKVTPAETPVIEVKSEEKVEVK
ncbi:hypothetical protein HXX01_04510, partial [Candidatus Nomurabacteria bacterium]|nr:hypothetical protein [Candidatus Nomurabacteria bacterium]